MIMLLMWKSINKSCWKRDTKNEITSDLNQIKEDKLRWDAKNVLDCIESV